MNIIHKIGIAIILIIAGFWSSAYLFNHVNPWLGIAAPVVAVILVLGGPHATDSAATVL